MFIVLLPLHGVFNFPSLHIREGPTGCLILSKEKIDSANPFGFRFWKLFLYKEKGKQNTTPSSKKLLMFLISIDSVQSSPSSQTSPWHNLGIQRIDQDTWWDSRPWIPTRMLTTMNNTKDLSLSCPRSGQAWEWRFTSFVSDQWFLQDSQGDSHIAWRNFPWVNQHGMWVPIRICFWFVFE